MKEHRKFVCLVAIIGVVLVVLGCVGLPSGNSPTQSVATSSVDLGSIQTIKDAQRALNAKGYNPGKADGIYGSKTARALRDFQRDSSLEANGELDLATAQALGIVHAQKQAQVSKEKKKGFMARSGDVMTSFSGSLREFGKGTWMEGGTNLASDIYGGIGKAMQPADEQSTGETIGNVNKNIADAVKK